MSLCCRWLAQLLRMDVLDRDPLLLDMGQFWVPTFGRQSAAGGSTAEPPSHGGQECPSHAAMAAAGANMEVDAAPAATSQGCPLANHHMTGVLQLYTVVARPLCARVKAWPSTLNLKKGVQQLGRGFLEAPGGC